jgi:uncharacterized protein YecA (UPF0149 family)
MTGILLYALFTVGMCLVFAFAGAETKRAEMVRKMEALRDQKDEAGRAQARVELVLERTRAQLEHASNELTRLRTEKQAIIEQGEMLMQLCQKDLKIIKLMAQQITEYSRMIRSMMEPVPEDEEPQDQ